jgi:hypothetical protein
VFPGRTLYRTLATACTCPLRLRAPVITQPYRDSAPVAQATVAIATARAPELPSNCRLEYGTPTAQHSQPHVRLWH